MADALIIATVQVARSRLTQRSQVLRDRLIVPQLVSASEPEIVLNDDPEDFEHFLWFIHAECVAWQKR